MAIKLGKYRVLNSEGVYEVVHLETAASQVKTTDAMQFASKAEKEIWNAKADAHDHPYRPIDWVPAWAEVTDKPNFHTVATSGDYADLINKPELGTVASKDFGLAEGQIPILGAEGKLNPTVIPALALTDTYTVADEAAMIALDAQPGDIAIRLDVNATFILKTAPANVVENWTQLLTPHSEVQSVNGLKGDVVLTPAIIGAEAAFAKKTAFNKDFGTTEGTVAQGNHIHAEYENQNAYSNIKIGETVVAAGSATDTFEYAASGNTNLVVDAATKKMTIAMQGQTVFTGLEQPVGAAAGTIWVDLN